MTGKYYCPLIMEHSVKHIGSLHSLPDYISIQKIYACNPHDLYDYGNAWSSGQVAATTWLLSYRTKNFSCNSRQDTQVSSNVCVFSMALQGRFTMSRWVYGVMAPQGFVMQSTSRVG